MALSSVAVVHISNLLEKMTSTDKDFRFMATNDLMNELQKDSIKLDDDCERKVVKQLLKLLEDKNGEVQNLAVKCLGPLVTKVKDPQVDLIVDSLCSNMSSNEAKEQLRDVSSVGLKTVIGELPPSANSPLATAMCRRITPRLVTAVNNGKNVAIQLEALDILADLLLRFTSIMQPHHEVVLDALLPQLSSPRLAVRKRCIMALSHLVTSCSQPHFETAMDFLTTELKKNTDSSTTRTYVNAIAAVSRAAGHRFGVYLSAVMPLLVRYCDAETVEKNQDGGDDELREFCIQAFESFVARCPREVESHIDEIVRLCCLFLCYDPNYHYGDDDGAGDSSMDGDYSNDGSDEDEQDYSDDEDMSWKVRRAAAKCLEAVLLTRRERLADMYKEVSPLLVSRFKEREENVKCDVFTAFIALLKHTKLTLPSSMQTDVRSLDMHSAQTPPAGNSVPFVFRAAADENHHDMEVDASTESQLCALLATQVPGVVRAIKGQLRDKSIKTRQSCFAVLTELLQVLPGCLSEHLTLLVPGIQLSLTDAHATSHSKIDTLNFIHVALLTHEPSVFQPHANVLVPLIVRVTGDTYYKVVSEALLVLQQFIRLLRQSTSSAAVSAEYAPLLETIYSAVFAKLQTVEADQEVKEKAIACSGQLVASFGDVLEKKLTQILPFFVDRLNNEITRLAAVRALTVIANSPLHVEVSSILSEVMLLLATFLRKNQRALKVSSLLLLNALFSHHRSSFSPEALDTVLSEMPPLIAEGDMQIAQHTVRLITLLLEFAPQSISALLISEILPRVFRLVESSLCQGASLTAAIDLFRSCVTTPSLSPPLNCMDLCSQLMTPMMPAQGQQPMGHDRLHKEGYRNIARCVAAVTEVANPNNSKAIVKMLTAQVSDPNSSDCVQFFGLLALGEIGRLKSSVLEDAHIVENIILPAFSSQKEDLQRAASQALGAVAVGNLSKYMPVVLKEISKQPRRQYLLLISLKEIISAESVDSFAAQNIMQPHMSGVWEVLMEHAVAKEEGTRNVVSECLGKLCLIDPGALLPQLRKTLSNESPLARATTVAALQYTIVETPQPIDSLLRTCISEFLNALHDDDLTVRRVALGTLNSAAHNKPSLVRDLLPTLLPAVYKETKVVKELIREVEMGPFKHMVDDGLDLRKSAFETMYTLLESCLERLDILEFIQHVEHGLLDHYDIKMLTYLMVSRLTALCPTHVLQRLEFIVEPLKQACTTKVKPNAVKQEFEKQDELKRAAIRAFTALQAVPDADRNPQFNDFLGLIRATPDLKQMYDAVHRDPKGSYADHHEMDTT